MKVGVFILGKNPHAKTTCTAMAEGIKACGEDVEVIPDTGYKRPEHDVAVFWGFVQTLQDIMADYKKAGRPAVYLDLGYWGRPDYYKVAVNSRHPTAYFQQVTHQSDRRDRLKIRFHPYHSSGHILLAGMGAKAAWAEKLEPVESWERNAVEQIRRFTDRPIIYRPKPSWNGAKPIAGAGYSRREEPLKEVLGSAWAVVTHHSNVAVDGLLMGVPAFAWAGVAKPMGLQDIAQIESPLYPSDREQWASDVAYCQWTLDEMRSGECWRHLKSEALVP